MKLEWKEKSREEVFKKYGRAVHKVVYEMPDGNNADFYVKIEGKPVCVLALTKDNKVILAKQFRPGPNKVMLELPGGAIEEGQTPAEAAEKELLEETGYKGNLKLITQVWEDAYSDTHRYAFVATGCEKVADQNLDQFEFIDVKLFELSEFREMLRNGEFTDTEVGYLGLDFLKLL